ncbi:divalent-cation tolerance protein CutA [Novosphingobium sp. 9]|uniref:divalent-cation tolerance protein CutA n=1 Tax=Novosphingobium sp. 9 TaxID=2025349 RepID=UPI0021B5681B|nr:divalent-cation tolerance protein CutA [Novosphingobium sp. 9]
MSERADASGQGALIWCPFPDEASALAVIDTLLDEGLVACGNVLPAMTSRFVWNGMKDQAAEKGVLFKTRAALLESAVARISALHPYETPAVLGWRCDAATPATLAWLNSLG